MVANLGKTDRGKRIFVTVSERIRNTGIHGFRRLLTKKFDIHKGDGFGLVKQFVKSVKRDVHKFGHFFICGGPAQFFPQVGIGFFKGGYLSPDRSGHPVKGTEFIKHCPFYTEFSVCLELNIFRSIKFIYCIDQTDDSAADQVVNCNVRRQSGG